MVTVTVTDNDGGTNARTFQGHRDQRKLEIASMGDPYAVTEGGSVTFGPSASDPDGDPVTYGWSFSDGSTATGAGPTRAYSDDTGQPFTATLTVTDDETLSATAAVPVTVRNAAPVLGAITGLPTDPIPAGTTVTLTASFTDAGIDDTHTGAIVWDVGAIATPATVSETGGSGTMSATQTLSAGVYTVSMSLTDNDGGTTSQSATQYIVVYDPVGGFATGGGWFTSPAGAYVTDPSLIGRATFGFVSRYAPGATRPSGNTEFQFRAADFTFRSVSHEWLVVAGPRAQYKGTGTLDGAGDYGFLLTAVDGQASGGGGVDRFRIKIWNRQTGTVVYDNQPGVAEDSDPSTALGGGSIVIHR